jgi:hypothetical protein
VPRARVLWTTSGDLRLGGHPGWRGDLAVVGLLVRGPLPGPVVLRSLDLVPERLDGAELLPRLWKEWSAFEGWNVRSINFTAGGKRNGLFPPTLAASIWVTLAALIHVGLARTRRRPPSGVSLVAIFLAGWAVLDLRWQVDLARQLRLTHDQYAGKSGEEKRLTAADRPLYLFAKAVTRHLDAAPSRVFLVSEDLFGERYFRRVRTHYFLLPHNVSSLWTAVPQASQTRTGDYVLVMRPCGNVTFDPERGLLRTGDLPGLPVEPLLEEHEGLLFRVR